MSNFRKIFFAVLVAFFLFQIISIVATGNIVLAEDIIYGDVNGDEEVNSLDLAIMRQHLLGKIKEFESEKAINASDVNGDGEFNSLDYAYVRKYLLGRIDTFPAYQNSTPTPTIIPTPTTSPSEFTKLKPSIVDVKMSDLSRNSVELLWNKVEGAVSYEVLRDDVSIGTTSDTSFADLSVIEGTNRIYKIRAVNAIGESSQDSSNIMVNTTDTVINSDTVLSEDRYYINLEGVANIDLNGYTLNVKGDFLQTKGNVNINSGSLKIDGNYTIDGDGLLHMTNEEDYVYVGGAFTTYSGDSTGELVNYYLTAGVMEVKGDFSCAFDRNEIKLGQYVASGSHKVILSGDKEQVVNNDSRWLIFNELEIKNEKGVKFTWITPVNLMQGDYKVIGDAYFHIGKIVGDVVIDGNLVIVDQEVDLAGHSLTVNGNLNQYFAEISDAKICKIKINGGKLIVNGNYIIGYDTNGNPENGYDKYSTLEMTNEVDYVYVGGDFITIGGDWVDEDKTLTAGVMEVKGDFICTYDREKNKYGRYVATGSHKVILSGDEEQTVNNNDYGWLVFNELEITNKKGVKFDSITYIHLMKGNYKIIGDVELIIGKVIGDVVIEGNVSIVNSEIDLNGYSLKIKGNLNQYTMGQNCKMKINGGRLIVEGNYIIGYDTNGNLEQGYDFYSTLEMTNEADYVYVGGDFITIGGDWVDEDKTLTAGVMEVKGDFICTFEKGKYGRYVATGSHKVILSGDEEQTVNNNDYGKLVFNELEIANEKGVKFDSITYIQLMKGNYKIIGDVELNIGKVIGDVVIEGNVSIVNSEIDLNGYSLKIKGNLNQYTMGQNCKIKINGGRLIVEGNYIIGYDTNGNLEHGYDCYSTLEMTNEADYVYVGGDFITIGGDWVDEDKTLTAGVMEVKGDFICTFEKGKYGRYVATGSHKVILSGDEEQTVNNNDYGKLVFNELEIANEKGVKFDSITYIHLMKGNYKIIGDVELIIGKVIGDVVIEGNVSIVNSEIDLNGYSLTITGNLNQYTMGQNCKIKINGGRLIVEGNYIIGYDTNGNLEHGYDCYSTLEMINEADYVYVGGDFITIGGDWIDEDKNLTAGVMEVKGDFICTYDREKSKYGRYVATGSHKVILSGDEEQTVNNNDYGRLVFNELEIPNEKGVKFDSITNIRLMKGNYKFIGDTELIIEKIIGDVVIDGNVSIISSEIDLNGYSLKIKGNLNQYAVGQNCIIKINGGNLIVEENYIIGYDTEGIAQEIYENYSTLEMTNEKDYVYVGGDFITIGGDWDWIDENKSLTAGVMEVKGDFICAFEKGKYGRYVATGSHKVILSGDEEQTVNNNDYGKLVFNELEITNEKGVKFDSITPIFKMKGHYKVIGEALLEIWSIAGDVVIEGNLTMVDNEIDLAGHNLTINGNLNQYSAGRLYSSDYEPFLTKIKINGGSLKVNGNYTIAYLEPYRIYAPGSIIEMTNEKDYVYVEGNFTIDSEIDHTEYLTAGILEVKGDFTQSNNPLNFAASGTHKTILSGDSVQTITFEYPETSSFNILKLTKPLDTGYIFNTTPVWKSLEE